MQNFKIAIGSDHAGFELKEKVRLKLKELGYEYYDFGMYDKTPADYPIIAKGIAAKVADGDFERGIILCGSGIGVAITANRIRGIRAANCNDVYCAKMSRAHNNSNILTLGGRILGEDVAFEIVKQVYVITKEEKIKSDFRLVDQFRGAAISIMNNIAEGFDSSSNKEFVRFLFYSSRSCSEVISMSYILKEIYNLQTESDDLYSKTLSCRKQIKGFIKYLKQN